MANENDYQSMKLSELVHHLEDLAIGNVQVIGTLEQIISNREAEIDGLKHQIEKLIADKETLFEVIHAAEESEGVGYFCPETDPRLFREYKVYVTKLEEPT